MPNQSDVMNQMAGQVERQQNDKPTIRQLLLDPQYQDEIAKALPVAMTPERFTRLAVTAVKSSPLLLEAEPVTLLAGVMQCAQLGLEPNTPLQHCWLLPFRNTKKRIVEVQFVLGYRGIIDLAHRSEAILDIAARTVRENDEFEYEYGLDEKLSHKPKLKKSEAGAPIAYYCLANFRGGGHYYVVVDPEEIEEHRQKSKSPDSPAWKDNYDPMARKTTVRIASAYLPLSSLAAEAIAADESTPSWEQFTQPSPAEQFIDVPSSEGGDNEDLDPENHCSECGEVQGEHRDDCSKRPKD